MLNRHIHGDCLEVMTDIPSNSVHLIKADLPYGTTRNKWDVIIPFGPLWEQYERIISPNGVILLNAVGLFAAKLIMSNPDVYRYDWIWEKTSASGHLNAKKMPMRAHEQILVFYKGKPVYNPQKTQGHERKVSLAKHKINCKKTTNYGEHGLADYDSDERYPRSVIKMKSDKQSGAVHPTQKPVALEEYFIKTYTDEGMTVLDNCSGSGTVGIACLNTNRNYILIEKDKEMYGKANKRIINRLLSDIL